MIEKKAGVVTKFREKVQAVSGDRELWTFHCILHQDSLCCKSLKMDHVMQVVVRTVHFIQARGLNHRQFDSLLSDTGFPYGLPCHTEVRWLSRGAVLKRFFDLREGIENFMKKRGKPVLEFQSSEWIQDLTFRLRWILHSTWIIIGTKCCKAAKDLSHSIKTPLVHSSWSCPCGRHNFPVMTFPLSKKCACHRTKQCLEHRRRQGGPKRPCPPKFLEI